MKTIAALCLVVLAAIATNVASYPVLEEEAPLKTSLFDVDAELAPVEEQGVRMRRLTCDLLSFQSKWVTPNHSACAAHCLALRRGFKGGRCQNGVCHCRK